MRSRPDRDRVKLSLSLARCLVDLGDELDLVSEEADADGVVRVGRPHVDDVAAHAEGAAREVVVVAVILDVDELVHEVVALERHVLAHVWREARVVLGAADAVDAGDGGHDDDVAARKQARRCLMAQLLDLLVYRGVLLDVGIGLRHVGFGLVVVVVAHEVDHGVVGEELAHLACDLRGERLVGLEDEGGAIDGLDDLGHRVGLARARDAHERLVADALIDAFGQLLDGLGLVARRLEGRHDDERLLPFLAAEAAQLRPNMAHDLGRRDSFRCL